jgi:hypothetical protein
MLSKYGKLIIEYLESPKIYSDIILKNKSKTSKNFYLMHIK